MRILSADDKRAERIVRDMEKRGFILTGAETSGAYDCSEADYWKDRKRAKRAKWSKRFSRFLSAIGFIAFLAFLWIVSKVL